MTKQLKNDSIRPTGNESKPMLSYLDETKPFDLFREALSWGDGMLIEVLVMRSGKPDFFTLLSLAHLMPHPGSEDMGNSDAPEFVLKREYATGDEFTQYLCGLYIRGVICLPVFLYVLGFRHELINAHAQAPGIFKKADNFPPSIKNVTDRQQFDAAANVRLVLPGFDLVMNSDEEARLWKLGRKIVKTAMNKGGAK